ncbi:MAG: NAD(P)/FAD-dependent oxidoreductase, partial [Acetobacteraceae bacterium]|nr:NAD(P)/FAD-dependent oxidoreductase [Acetobacteraceae bacterium]
MTAKRSLPMRPAPSRGETFDAVIVGAGFAGLYMLHRLRALGIRAIVFEAGNGVGGTWYWNRYPGARCDVQSMEYSYSFSADLQQEWRWTERFAAQPEILRYAEHVADRFDLRRDIRFGTRVTRAAFEEAADRWRIETERGDEVVASFCVMATGCLSVPQRPEIAGAGEFRGPVYHTGTWPHDPVDFTGQRVGVIGTGSSAIQSIPVIAQQAQHLVVFQRTPNFSVPARNTPMDPEFERAWKQNYPEHRRRARMTRPAFLNDLNDTPALAASAEEHRREFEARWRRGGLPFMAAFNDLVLEREANDIAADFVRARIAETVRDKATAAALMPTGYPIGTKRLCADSSYFETFNRDNVTLVDLTRAPITAITPDGLHTRDAAYALDSIVFATGFDAMTGALARIDIRGRDGRLLAATWADGPRTYLGLMSAGFPNLFFVTGPGSPSVLTNMMMAIEQHVEWIADCIAFLRARGLRSIEPDAPSETAWVAH